jgi:hypothetical protein
MILGLRMGEEKTGRQARRVNCGQGRDGICVYLGAFITGEHCDQSHPLRKDHKM